MDGLEPGRVQPRAPEGSRTLWCDASGIWIWPGLRLTGRHGTKVKPLGKAAFLAIGTHLVGFLPLFAWIYPQLASATRFLARGQIAEAQRILDRAGAPRLQPWPPFGDGHLAGAGSEFDPAKHPRKPPGTVAPDGESAGGRFTDAPHPLKEPQLPATMDEAIPRVEPYRPKPDKSGKQLTPRQTGRRIARGAASKAEAMAELVKRLHDSGLLDELLARVKSWYDGPQDLETLQDAVKHPEPGYEIHHIVEKTPNPKYADRLDESSNLVRIPTFKHRDISDWFSTPNNRFTRVIPGTDRAVRLSPRDWLRDETWDTKYQVGLEALRVNGVLK